MSTISDTDLKVFAALVNPSKVNVDRVSQEDEPHRGYVREEDDSSDDSHRDDDEREQDFRAPTEVSYISQPTRISDKHDDSDNESRAGSERRSNDGSDAGSRAGSNAGSNAGTRAGSRVGSYVPSHVSRHEGTQVSAASARSSSEMRNTLSFDSFVNRDVAPQTPSLPVLSSLSGDAEVLEKQQVLIDMERLKMQGMKMSKEWTINDRLEDMQFEMRRHLLHIDEMNNINMMRDGMRLMCSGFEMLNSRIGLLELDGWAADVCQDMTKYDNALGRIYRKYWRKSSYNSPEIEIAVGLIGSLGMYHFKQKLKSQMFGKSRSMPPPSDRSRPAPAPPSRVQEVYQKGDESSSEEEEPP